MLERPENSIIITGTDVDGKGMTETHRREHSSQKDDSSTGITVWLLRAKAKTGARNPHFWIIIGLFIVFSYVYYGVLTSFQDIYVIIFFYPLIYAAIVYRLRGVIVSGLVFLGILLPQALLFAHDPVSLMRTLIFALFAYLVASLGATLLNYLEHQLETHKEILSLNDELNDSIVRLQKTQQQLIQAAKLSSIGQLAAAVYGSAAVIVNAKYGREILPLGIISK
jgi:hypothetical protein